MKIVNGDLLEATETYLCHQCNCVTNRSKHLATSVFKKFPYADVYTSRKEPDTPGTVILRGDGKSQRYVAAILGQYYPGKTKYPNSNKDGWEARLSYFKKALKTLTKLEGSFAFPWRIGCGAAGGNWEAYQKVLQEFSDEIQGEVVIYKLGPEPKQKMASLFDE